MGETTGYKATVVAWDQRLIPFPPLVKKTKTKQPKSFEGKSEREGNSRRKKGNRVMKWE